MKLLIEQAIKDAAWTGYGAEGTVYRLSNGLAAKVYDRFSQSGLYTEQEYEDYFRSVVAWYVANEDNEASPVLHWFGSVNTLGSRLSMERRYNTAIVIDWVDGCSPDMLPKKVSKHQRIKLLGRIVRAFESCEKLAGRAHGDAGPQNCLITGDLDVKVIDPSGVIGEPWPDSGTEYLAEIYSTALGLS